MHKALAQNALSIIPTFKQTSKEFRNQILPRLRNDEISLIVKQDPLIIAFGCRLLKKKKERRSRKSICSKMRDLAHLLNIVRKNHPEITKLEDLINPKYYDYFIETVKIMCGFNEETGAVEVISIPARLRPEILGCIEILYTKIIMDGSKSEALKTHLKNQLSDFKLLLEANWQWEIATNAEKSRKRKLMVKEQVMPLEEDIAKVMSKIHELEELYYEELKTDATIVNYENLCEVTIAHIILLDRKRSGDVAEAELNFYLNRKTDDIPRQVLETLNKKENEAISELDIFQIPGKRGRPVPVLLTRVMKRNIDLIIAKRSPLQIPYHNKYLFARPMTLEPFDGGKCLNLIKNMCHLKKPNMLTSTGLRHHIATVSQIHGNENYTQNLATFLGHDMAIHASNYRLPIQAIQKGVVGSKLLEIEDLSTYQSNIEHEMTPSNVEAKDRNEEIQKKTNKIVIVTEHKRHENQVEENQKKEATLETDSESSDQKNNNNNNNIEDEKKKFIRTTIETDLDSSTQEKNKKRDEKKKMKRTIEIDSDSRDLEGNNKKDGSKKIKWAKIRTDSDSSGQEENENQNEENKMGRTPREQKLNSSDQERNRKQVEKKKKRRATIESDLDSSDLESNKKQDMKKKIKRLKKDTDSDSSDQHENENQHEEKKKRSTKRRKKTHTKWSDAEVAAVMRHLKKYIQHKKNPGKAKCVEVLRKEPILHKRTWMQLNTYINNVYKKIK